jgi:hypothetical protein
MLVKPHEYCTLLVKSAVGMQIGMNAEAQNTRRIAQRSFFFAYLRALSVYAFNLHTYLQFLKVCYAQYPCAFSAKNACRTASIMRMVL